MRILSFIITIAMTALQTVWAQNNTGSLVEWTETDYSDFEITHEFFTPDGIAKSGSGGYDMTGYIPVKKGDVIVFSGDRSPGIPFVMGYADNGGGGATLLFGDFDENNWNDLQVTDAEVSIPEGMAYVRCSARNTSLPNWASQAMLVIKRSLTDKLQTVRILAVGNSFTIDAFESGIYDIAKAQGIELVLGNACYAGYTLENHWNGLVTDLANLEYRKCVNRHYTTEKGYTLSSILSDEPWDFITFQQASFQAGFYETYEPWLTNLIDNIKAYVPNPNVKYGFYMIWAYAQDSPSVNFPRYDRNQMTMFNSIVDATRKAKETHPELEFLIPTGTAIQNLRTSFIGDNLTRDGAHLTEDLGRHANAYTWLAVLFGKERLCQNTYVPFNLNEYTSMMARNAALSAIENPYIITPQNYPDYAGDNTIVPADILFNFSFEGTFTEGWNDVMLHHVLTAGHKDTKGKDSGIVIQCDSSFTNANFAGVLETNALLEMPSDVSQTALWGYSEGNFNDFPQVPTVTLYFKHLNKSLVYDFTFFSSRASTTDNRETQFTLVGQETKTATLDASNNKSKTVTVSDIQPDEEGTIALTVQAGPNNNNFYKFYYLNALRISAHELNFALTGDEQPKAGESLSVSSNGDLSGYTFKWTRGNALGAFGDTVLSSTKDYVITENDYEHWLRVSVCDNAGNTVFTKDTWISKLPVLYIDTEDGNQITSKDFYVTANLRIQGNAEFEQQYLGITEIKGRGSSSWNTYPQKPYKLRLDKKTNLFGFGKCKHWVLISNFNDKCSLRNYTASRLAKELGIIGMEMTWVDVVLNGEAKGCYMLSQHVRVDKNCVDIFDWEGEAEDVADALFAAVKDADALAETDQELLEEKMEKNLTWVTDGRVNFKGKTYNLSDYGLKKEYDITKGYLLEIAQKIYGHSHYMTPQGVNFEVSAPEYLSTNREMFSYVKDLWDNFEAEYCRVPTIEGKNFSKYADMQSMVGIWFVNEILAQGDLNNSRYCYIPDDGKIHFGPAWDFDHAAASWTTSRKTVCFYTSLAENKYLVFKKWFPDPVLCQMAYDTYWNVARPFMMDLLSEGGEMDTRYIYIAEADKTNDTLWGSYPSLLNPNAIARTAAEDYQILRTFLADHINWLDEQFQSVITLIEAMNKVFMYPCSQEIIDGIQNLESNRRTGVQKIIHDKHLYIIRDGETYSVDGKRIK